MNNASIRYLPKLDYSATEAMNTLATNITFCGSDTKVIQITSCREREGKSSICLGLWRTLAQMGYRVLLVDADLRRSVFNSTYGVRFQTSRQGLTHFLSKDGLNVEDVVYRTNVENGYLLPSGHDVANSNQLLSSRRLSDLMKELKGWFDYVIVDTTPVGAIVDAATISQWCDGTLLVITQDETTKQEIIRAKEQIEKAGQPVLGAILNRVAMDKSSSRYYNKAYYSAYESYYYQTDERKGKKKAKK